MLKIYRLKRNLTQEKLSEMVGIDLRSYQKIEAGSTIPLVNTFAKLVFSLNMDKDAILKELDYYSHIEKKKGKNRTE